MEATSQARAASAVFMQRKLGAFGRVSKRQGPSGTVCRKMPWIVCGNLEIRVSSFEFQVSRCDGGGMGAAIASHTTVLLLREAFAHKSVRAAQPTEIRHPRARAPAPHRHSATQ